jgi:CubicO group peptidase (beta-lactamase class C family)
VSGGAHWGGGLWVNTLDHARFGMLYLNRGRWGDRQIISEKWVDMMTVPSENNPLYGYMWWLNTGHGLVGSHASESTFVASGAGGNKVVIDPEKNLVVVTRWCEDVSGVVDLAAQAVGSS